MIDLGTLPDWLAALATAAGFWAALHQIRLNRDEQREARKEAAEAEKARQRAEALAVGVKANWKPVNQERGEWQAEVTLMNASPYAISSVVLVVAADAGDHQIVYGAVLPGTSDMATYDVARAEVVFGELTGGVKVWFTDAYDNHWERTPWDLTPREYAARIC